MRNQSSAKLHCSRSDLINYYYGIAERPENIEHHLQDCLACAVMHRSITIDLNLVRDLYRREAIESVDASFFERETRYLMHRIEEIVASRASRRTWQQMLAWWRYVTVGASIILVLILGITYYSARSGSDLNQLRAKAEAIVIRLEKSPSTKGRPTPGFEDEKTRPGFPVETEIPDSTDLFSEMD